MNPRPCRRAIVVLTSGSLFEMLAGLRYVAGLPPDARVVSVHSQPENQSVLLVLEHGSFEEVPDGGALPILHPQAYTWTFCETEFVRGEPIYIDPVGGSDDNDGRAPDRAKRLLRAAVHEGDARLLRFKTADGWEDALGPVDTKPEGRRRVITGFASAAPGAAVAKAAL